MSKLVSHEKNVAVFTEVLKYETFKEKLQEAYNKNKGRFNIAGFRKGKAPRSIIEANYGKEVFWNDAIDLVLPEMYEKAIEELGLSPVSRPQIDIEETIEVGKDMEIRFEVETFPEIELADYSNIEVEEFEKEISEDLVDAKIAPHDTLVLSSPSYCFENQLALLVFLLFIIFSPYKYNSIINCF